MIGFKDHLLSQGLSPTTVKDMVSTIRTVYNLALHNERLDRKDNPAQGVKVARRSAPGTQRRDYTLEEAGKVLRAALALRAGSQSDQDVAWTILLMATTGARLGEVAGALVGDVRHDAAGEASEERGLKTEAAARNVPLPAQVEEWGLIESLKGRQGGAALPEHQAGFAWQSGRDHDQEDHEVRPANRRGPQGGACSLLASPLHYEAASLGGAPGGR